MCEKERETERERERERERKREGETEGGGGDGGREIRGQRGMGWREKGNIKREGGEREIDR